MADVEAVLVMVETPTGSRNKYEYDGESGRFYLDRMLFSVFTGMHHGCRGGPTCASDPSEALSLRLPFASVPPLQNKRFP